jgi:GNAT superfamily N-acetyltransferase
LCHADHRGDDAILAKWLSNKTPQHVADWIAHADNRAFVASDESGILGVAMITVRGEVLLNYVSPDARFRGVSKALLARLEATARALGLAECRLTSTLTAERFYTAAGYRDHGPPPSGLGAGIMVKRLQAD